MHTDLIPIADAAAQRGVSYHVLVWLVRRGVLPVEKRVGARALLVRLTDVDAALAQRRTRGYPKGRPRHNAATSDDEAVR